MSIETVRNHIEQLTDYQKLLLFGVINLNRKDLEFSWDFDQVLIKTEIPVIDYCDKDIGTHFAGRKIKGWNSVSNWLVEEGKMEKAEADAYENWIWTNPKILQGALPNESLRALSFVAWQRGIKQTVTTSRIPELAETTHRQIELFFWWLKDNVNQRTELKQDQSGEDYKVLRVSGLLAKNPGVVHLDDSMTFVRKLIQAAPKIDLIGFPCEEDAISDMLDGRRIFCPDISIFDEMIPYRPFESDMAALV